MEVESRQTNMQQAGRNTVRTGRQALKRHEAGRLTCSRQAEIGCEQAGRHLEGMKQAD